MKVESIAIEALLQWSFQTECARLDGDGFVAGGLSMTAVVAAIGDLGCAISSTGDPAHDVADDAALVADLVARLPRAAMSLVVHCARAGSTPNWRPDARWRFEPAHWDWDESGEPFGVRDVVTERQVYEGPDGRVVERDVVVRLRWYDPACGRMRRTNVEWVPVREVDRPDHIAQVREDYGLWWSALLALRNELRGQEADRLTRWRVSVDLPPVAPWIDMQKAA